MEGKLKDIIDFGKLITSIEIKVSTLELSSLDKESPFMLLKYRVANSILDDVKRYLPDDEFNVSIDIFKTALENRNNLFKKFIAAIHLIQQILSKCCQFKVWDDEKHASIQYFPSDILSNIFSRIINLFIILKEYDLAIFILKELMLNDKYNYKKYIDAYDYYRLGRLYELTGFKKEATETFNKILLSYPNSDEAIIVYKMFIEYNNENSWMYEIGNFKNS